MDINTLLSRIPCYERFLGVDELFARARDAARDHPDLCVLTEIGASQAGDAIPMVSIGHGKTSILMFASPHPNEPIGAMLTYFLLEELISDASLREGRTWHIIPCIDPDGTRLNEDWFSGPFTLKNYCRNFYRPKGENQAEWTFPFEYKTFRFDSPIPETQALMRAIDQTRPDIMYALHNAGFGGAYYYISDPLEPAYETFHRLPTERGLPLSLGEPEMPYCTEFHPGVYKTVSVRDAYDYYERFADGDPARRIFAGGSSKDYAAGVSDPFCLITEVPYFITAKVNNQTTVEKTRGEVIIEGIDAAEELLSFAHDVVEKTKHLVHEGPLLKDAAVTFIPHMLEDLEGMRSWAQNDEAMNEPATVAQQFDAREIKLFYNGLIISMYRRAMRMQLAAGEDTFLRSQYELLDARLDELMDRLGTVLEYEAASIRSLVQIQYGALLATLDALGR